MAINMWGANGTWVNKMGSAIGHYVNGKTVLTALPHPSSKPATASQVAQQTKFGLVTGFLSYIGGLVKVGFQNEGRMGQSAMNLAVAHNLKNAVTGVAPDFTMDYAKVVYSMGKVDRPANAKVTAAEGAELAFTWTEYPVSSFGSMTDMATILVYNPDKDWYVQVADAALRSELAYSLQLPADFTGDEVHCYISFVSADGKRTSKSLYLEALTVL